jgi:hypothetical protein
MRLAFLLLREESGAKVSDKILVQYIGFQAKSTVREYSFTVRAEGESREFTLTIENQAFTSHRARYQDAPDICALRLRAELAAFGNHPTRTCYEITGAELDSYRQSHLPEAFRKLYRSRTDEHVG